MQIVFAPSRTGKAGRKYIDIKHLLCISNNRLCNYVNSFISQLLQMAPGFLLLFCQYWNILEDIERKMRDGERYGIVPLVVKRT